MAINCFEYKLSNYVLMIQVSNKELLQVAMEAKKRIGKNNVSIFNASKKQYSLPTTTKSSHKQKPVSYTNSPYAIQNDILGGYRAEMEAEAAAKKQNARAYSVDVFDPQAVYRLMTSTMSTTEIVIAFVIWFAIRLVIIVAFYYLARGVRRLWRAPFEKPAAVVLSVLLAVPSVLSFLFIAMIPAELSQYKDGFWLLFSWIVFFYFSYKYWRAICNVLINDYLETDEEGGKISAFMANSAQGITNAAKNLELGDKLAQLFRQKMVMYIALVALLIVVLGATYYYLSPYHTCVRTMMSENTKDPRYSYQNYSKRDAIIFCSRSR